jgi:hypothetical protein
MAHARKGKLFHSEEPIFRRRGPEMCERSNGRANFKATRLYPSWCCIRKTRARSVRATLGSAAIAANGALGISSETCCVERRIGRRTASSIPPAETLRAVANSKSSLSASPRLLTKTGMAKGKRDQRRRSAKVLVVTRIPSPIVIYDRAEHPTGQNLRYTAESIRKRREPVNNRVNSGILVVLKPLSRGNIGLYATDHWFRSGAIRLALNGS